MAWISLLDYVYPVGSVYLSTSSLSPAQFIGGTWQQVTGKFVRAGVTAKTTGGSDTHSHTYGWDYLDYYSSMANFNNASIANYMGIWDDDNQTYQSGNLTTLNSMWGTVNAGIQNGSRGVDSIANHHGTKMTIHASNMPSYYDVFMWIRTA